MGIIRRQSILILIISTAGMVLGYVNKVFLFTHFLTKPQYGDLELLIVIALTAGELAKAGVSSSIIRFFPFFKGQGKKEKDFMSFTLIFPLLGFLLFSIVFLCSSSLIASAFSDKSPGFSDHMLLVIPLLFFHVYSEVADNLLKAQLQSVAPTFIRELILRVLQAGALLVYVWGVISLDQFYLLYVGTYFLQMLLLFGVLLYRRSIRFHVSLSSMWRRSVRMMMNYSLYSVLTSSAAIILMRLDAIMLGLMVGNSATAIYALAFNLGSIIYLPGKAINNIGYPVIARSAKARDMKNVLDIYKKSCFQGILLGGFFWVIITVNLPSFFTFGSLPDYVDGIPVVILVGAAKFMDIATGLNTGIILASRHFRFELISSIVLVIFAFALNYILIPGMEATGAAITTVIAATIYNLARTVFVWIKFRMWPYDKRSLAVLAIGVAAFLAASVAPHVNNAMADIALRGSIVAIIYAVPVFIFRLAPEITDLVVMRFKR